MRRERPERLLGIGAILALAVLHRRAKLPADVDGPTLAKQFEGVEKRPILRRFDRRRHIQEVVLNVLETNGHVKAIQAARRPNGTIDWKKLLDLIVEYLPKILAIILPLFAKR